MSLINKIYYGTLGEKIRGLQGLSDCSPHKTSRRTVWWSTRGTFSQRVRRVQERASEQDDWRIPPNRQGQRKLGDDLRYDREKPCTMDILMTSSKLNSVQANINAKHPQVLNLSKNANGQHRAPQRSIPDELPTFGSSTIASVILQQNTGGLLKQESESGSGYCLPIPIRIQTGTVLLAIRD